jgi:hypothetical protein
VFEVRGSTVFGNSGIILQLGITSNSKLSAVALRSLVVNAPYSSSEDHKKMCGTGIVK